MKASLAAVGFGAIMLAGLALPATPAQAAGCVSGAAVGGVAGHVAGHHGVLGAAAGCAVGHHEAAKNERQATQNAQPAAPANTQR